MTTLTELAGHPFLAGLTGEQLDVLRAAARPVRFAPATRIFEEGGPADRFWLLTDGLVHLDTVVPGRGRVIIESLPAGTVLGWSWLFPPYRWAFGAVAAGPVEAFEFDGRAVRACCESDPVLGYELTRRLAHVVAKRLQATRVRLITASSQPTVAR